VCVLKTSTIHSNDHIENKKRKKKKKKKVHTYTITLASYELELTPYFDGGRGAKWKKIVTLFW